MEYVQVGVGLVLMVLAGDALVRGAVGLAFRLDMSPLVIGLTIVALGTSAPELVVGVDAVLKGAPTLALGNVVGSNIANILLVIGLPAIILPIRCASPGVLRTTITMLLVTGLVMLLGVYGSYGWGAGLMLVTLLAVFIYDSIRNARKSPANVEIDTAVDEDVAKAMSLPVCLAFLLGGLAGVAFGADWLIRGAVTIAQTLGVSEAVIGLTLVALGTSLPELSTALIAAVKGHEDVAVGNVIGSNIFNLLGILGVSSMVGTIPVPQTFWDFDFWVMLASSCALLPFALARRDVNRFAGAVLFSAYAAYIFMLARAGEPAAKSVSALWAS